MSRKDFDIHELLFNGVVEVLSYFRE